MMSRASRRHVPLIDLYEPVLSTPPTAIDGALTSRERDGFKVQVRKTSRTRLVSLYSSPSAISSPSKRR
jgi:hypothetical protein